MRKADGQQFEPLSPFSLAKSLSGIVRLQSSREVLEISALGPDSFRLRIAKGTQFAPWRSWAVEKAPPSYSSAKLRVANGTVALRTQRGQLRVCLADGSWALLDSAGKRVFS